MEFYFNLAIFAIVNSKKQLIDLKRLYCFIKMQREFAFLSEIGEVLDSFES